MFNLTGKHLVVTSLLLTGEATSLEIGKFTEHFYKE